MKGGHSTRRKIQSEAFRLFYQTGATIFDVAEILDIPVSEARKCKLLLMEADAALIRRQEEISKFLKIKEEKERAKREQLLLKLYRDLGIK